MSNEALRHSLEADAEALEAQMKSSTDKREQRKLLQKYRLLQRQIEAIPADESAPVDREAIKADIQEQIQRQKANWKLKEEALRSGNDPYAKVREREQKLEKIEKDRKHIVEKQRVGGGVNTHRRIKAELDHLLNNYDPANDNKIDTLIDKWRRSGDPAYDPSIKVRFRNVKAKKSRSDYAL